tara:strand:+ start:100 stop:273 length:174 start_codon:yes stop_codon:yes gene_type:complete
MINWINGYKPGNKKEKYEMTFRLGTFTVLEIKVCLSCKEDCTSKKFRLMMLNLGFEI